MGVGAQVKFYPYINRGGGGTESVLALVKRGQIKF